jgi:hypothetical protein
MDIDVTEHERLYDLTLKTKIKVKEQCFQVQMVQKNMTVWMVGLVYGV